MRNIDACERRAELLRLIYETPLTTMLIAAALDVDYTIIKSDMAALKRQELLYKAGRMRSVRTDGKVSKITKWGAVKLMTAKEIEHSVYHREPEQSKLPDLPDSILTMMGYNIHGEPRGGVFVDNEDFMPEFGVSKVKVYPGTSWGMMEMAL